MNALAGQVGRLCDQAATSPSAKQTLYHLLSTHPQVDAQLVVEAASRFAACASASYPRKLLNILASRRLRIHTSCALNSILQLESRWLSLSGLAKAFESRSERLKLPGNGADHGTFCLLFLAAEREHNSDAAKHYFSLLLDAAKSSVTCERDFHQLLHKISHGYSRNLAECEQLFAALSRTVDPDFAVYYAMIQINIAGGILPRAIELVELMHAAGIPILDHTRNPRVYKSFDYARFPGMIDVDIRIFELTLKESAYYDGFLEHVLHTRDFNRILSLLSKSSSSPEHIDRILDLMLKANVPRDKVTENILLKLS